MRRRGFLAALLAVLLAPLAGRLKAWQHRHCLEHVMNLRTGERWCVSGRTETTITVDRPMDSW